jgi:hypothetical protein
MLDMENEIQDRLNEAGRIATAEALKQFDTDGSPISLSGKKLTARKQKVSQSYECPYGTVPVDRYLYQSNEGGYTYCPLEDGARIFTTSTPRYAQIVSGLYADLDGGKTKRHLFDILRRETCKRNIQNLAEAVATVAQLKEEKWEYYLPELDAEVASVAFGLDGAYMLMREDGWREAMCGTISLYDKLGNRLHTSYFAAPPEHGKQAFHTKLDREIQRTKELFPKARYIGLGDGAKDNWTYLKKHTDELLLDFWHVSEYVHKAADAYWGTAQKWQESKEDWLEEWLHRLKHEPNGASAVIAELKKLKKKLKGDKATTVQKTIGYMENHLELLDYALFVKRCLPIGSGVIEASCKTVVKARMCVSGAGWSPTGAGVVLSLRTLYLSQSSWEGFWNRMMRYGIPGSKTFGEAKSKETKTK